MNLLRLLVLSRGEGWGYYLSGDLKEKVETESNFPLRIKFSLESSSTNL